MEFDTKISLRTLGRFDVVSGLEPDAFGEKIWEIARSQAKEVGEGGLSEFWLDYSDTFRTRHLVIDFDRTDEEGVYHVNIKAGRRQSTVIDIIVGFLLILAFWLCSKTMGPVFRPWMLVGAIVAAAVAAAFALYGNKDFGKAEAVALEDAIKKTMV